jgi:hypothetical protein
MSMASTARRPGLRGQGVWRAGAALASLLMLSACAVGVGYGPGYDGPDGYVGGVYEPYGYDYGGWGGRYRVGPPRGGFHGGGGDERGRGGPRGGDEHGGGEFHGGDERGGGGPRGGGGGRGAPSIPSGPRGGGGHPR